MQYALLFFESARDFSSRASAEAAQAYWEAWGNYLGALQEGGILRGGTGLEPPQAGVHLRLKGGQSAILEGADPSREEHLGGILLIEVQDLASALGWAARSPNSRSGYTEVRPVMPPMA